MDRRTGEVVLLQRRLANLARGAWPFALTVVWWPSLLSGEGTGTAHFVFWMALGVITVRRELAHNRAPKEVPARYAIGREAVTIGEKAYARAGIRAGYLMRGACVRLHPRERHFPLDLQFPTDEAAQAFLDELHLGAGQHAAVFHAMAGQPQGFFGWLRRLGPIALVLFLWSLVGFSQGWFMLGLLLPGLLHTLGWRRRAIVGSDGVRVERGLAWDRFLPFATIAAVKVSRVKRNRDYFQTTIVSRDGEETRVGFPSQDEAEAFRRRVDDARAQAADNVPAAEALARAAGDVSSWIQRLRTVTLRQSHRTNAVSAETLWPVLESAASKPLERAAAAVALGDLDEHGRRRIAEVAAATASPRLRVVLDAVHDGAEDEAIAEALAALEAEEGTASA